MIRKTLLFLFLLNCSLLCLSQIIKYKSTSVSFKTVDQYGKPIWTSPEKAEILITIDFKNEIIKAFSNVEQSYKVIKFFDKETDSDGDFILKFQCVNQDNVMGLIQVLILNSQNGKVQFYVDFGENRWMYNVYKLT